ncbi:MAG: 30S ribosomal protein S10 [Candidatus Abawacabacteria bacterium]|nr:30S ribosomal protein S10 [Candidatus Abawacabacteria bacterium]
MAQSNKPKIRIKVRAYDHRVIDAAAKVIIETAERTGALIAGPIPLPTRIKKFTVLKSTFVHKNARDQFEIRTHKRIIDITESTSKTIDALSSITLPAGVEIEVKMLAA